MYCQFTMQCFSILARKSKLYWPARLSHTVFFKNDQIKVRLAKTSTLARSVRPPCTRNTRTTMDISSSENELQQSSSTAPQPAVEAAPDGVFLPDANPARAHNTADASASSREKKMPQGQEHVLHAPRLRGVWPYPSWQTKKEEMPELALPRWEGA